MANRCITTYEVFDFDNFLQSGELDELENVLNEYSNDLEGLLRHYDIDPSDICLRGYVEEIDRDDTFRLRIKINSAWTPIHDVVDAVISLPKFNHLQVTYRAEESGNEYYTTNMEDDTTVITYVRFTTDDGKEIAEEECHEDMDQALEYLCKMYGQEFKSLDEVNEYVEQFKQEHPDNDCCFCCNEYEYEDYVFGSRENIYLTPSMTTQDLVDKCLGATPCGEDLAVYVQKLCERGVLTPSSMNPERCWPTVFAVLARYYEKQSHDFLNQSDFDAEGEVEEVYRHIKESEL